jgi:hypothetical protein
LQPLRLMFEEQHQRHDHELRHEREG